MIDDKLNELNVRGAYQTLKVTQGCNKKKETKKVLILVIHLRKI